MFEGLILILLAAQSAEPRQATAGEESLIWMPLADPDPNFVPPPLSPEERAWSVRSVRTPVASSKSSDNEVRRRMEAEMRKVEAALARACAAARDAPGLTGGPSPSLPSTCSR